MQVYLIKYCSLERLVLYLNAFIPLSTSPDFRRKYSFDNVSYWVLKKKKQDLKKKKKHHNVFLWTELYVSIYKCSWYDDELIDG